MFTGLVQDIGTVRALDRGAEGARIEVETALAGELSSGDSIAVAGACLTAVEVSATGFAAEVMNQSLRLTTLGELEAGARVNLEPALRAGDRLGGHFVQGHVDTVGRVASVVEEGFARRLRVMLEDRLVPYLAPQGSVAVDGVSLTIADLGEGWLEVALIPETLERTTLGGLAEGDRVNLECDLLAKHAARLLSRFVGKEGD